MLDVIIRSLSAVTQYRPIVATRPPGASEARTHDLAIASPAR